MKSIFLCHSSKDKFFVRELAALLEAAGVKVWLDEAELKIGDSLLGRIGDAIQYVDYVGVILSVNSIDSEWVNRELKLALTREFEEKQVVVLPLLREKVEIPLFLKDKVYADFTEPDQENFQKEFGKLLKTLEVPDEVIESQSLRAPPAEPPPAPSQSPEKTESQRRLCAFRDLSIVTLDDDRTEQPDPRKDLLNFYLRLSDSPPYEWEEIFEAERRFPRHSMWRRAWIEGDHIVVYCLPDELRQYHLFDLKQDVANANRKYREYLQQLIGRELAEQKKESDALARARNLKDILDFD